MPGVERPIAPILYIKQSGIFDMDKIYNFVYSWLGYKNYMYHEKMYKHKPGFVKGNELEIEIEGFKKVTGYLQYWMEIKFHLWDFEDIEVLQEGKKKRLTKTKMRIQFRAWLVLDWEGRWEGTKMLEGLRDFYHNYIIKKRIEDDWEYGLYQEEYEIHDKLKEMLDQEAAKWLK